VIERRAVRPDGDLELKALERKYAGVVHQARVEALGHRLDSMRGMAVTNCSRGMCGDRVAMWLDNGMLLQLRLFWPIRVGVAALCAVAWHDDIGWVVDVRTSSGEPRRLYAWQAKVTFTD
jgi:hypothetical protein